MENNWAGRSSRDQQVMAYVRELLLPRKAPRARAHAADAPPGGEGPGSRVTLLLGSRGSGKTTLLQAVADWACAAPVASLDLRKLHGRGRSLVEVLGEAALAFGAAKANVPRLLFPAFGVVRAALDVSLEGLSREQAREAVRVKLEVPNPFWLGPLLPLVEGITGITAPGVLPAGLVDAAGLFPSLRGAWRRRTLVGERRARELRKGLDFLVELNLAYSQGTDVERRTTEKAVCRLFFQELDRAYRKKRWATRCLLLLDNVDNRLGGDLMRLLLDDDSRPGEGHPLVVLATAGSYPETLQEAEFGWAHPGGGHPGRWADGSPFVPEKVADGLLCVAQLRDLNRAEVARQVHEILPKGPGLPDDVPEAWLGWLVYELTRGQPEGTSRVLAALAGFEEGTGWEERLRTIFAPAPDMLSGLLDRLLPTGQSAALRDALARAAVSPDLSLALGANWLQDEDRGHLLPDFLAFCQDHLLTRHVVTGETGRDGLPGTPHPLVRRLLLAALREPGGVHAELRAEAEARDARNVAAYHALAGGDLPAAAAHLDSLVEQVTPEEWCRELARLRRVPLPAAPVAPADPWVRYEALVRHLQGAGVDARLRTVTRLLAASWLSPEPPGDRPTDWVGDPYQEPLADPLASLHPEVVARLRTLAAEHANRGTWPGVLYEKAQQYTKVPWTSRPRTTSPSAGPGLSGRLVVPGSPMRRRRGIAAATAVVLLATGAGLWQGIAVGGPDECAPGIARKAGGECIGVSDGSFAFPPLGDLGKRILAENRRVEKSGEPSVTVAYLESMSGGVLDRGPEGVRQAVTGAHVAQLALNAERGTLPRVRLVLANTGRGDAYAGEVVAQLLRERDRRNLVAVAGLGQSVKHTVEAVESLRRAGVPSVGATVAANGMSARTPGFFRIAFAARTQAQAAAAHFAREAKKHPGNRLWVVRDNKADDFYSPELYAGFMAAARTHGLKVEQVVPITSGQHTGGGNALRVAADKICGAGSKPHAVYFAARGRELRSFVEAAGEGRRSCPVKVLSGSSAVGLYFDTGQGPSGTGDGMAEEMEELRRRWEASGVQAYYTAYTHPALTARLYEDAAHNPYEDFKRRYLEVYGAAPGELDNGQAMVGHDAVLTVGVAARRARDSYGQSGVTARTVMDLLGQTNGAYRVRGVVGPVSFGPDTGEPTDRPMALVRLGKPQPRGPQAEAGGRYEFVEALQP
jgi:ABC-type branched-subunit amino acid transport system substrate-binding protein